MFTEREVFPHSGPLPTAQSRLVRLKVRSSLPTQQQHPCFFICLHFFFRSLFCTLTPDMLHNKEYPGLPVPLLPYAYPAYLHARILPYLHMCLERNNTKVSTFMYIYPYLPLQCLARDLPHLC